MKENWSKQEIAEIVCSLSLQGGGLKLAGLPISMGYTILETPMWYAITV